MRQPVPQRTECALQRALVSRCDLLTRRRHRNRCDVRTPVSDFAGADSRAASWDSSLCVTGRQLRGIGLGCRIGSRKAAAIEALAVR